MQAGCHDITIFQVVETGLTGEAFFGAKSRLGHQPTAASTSRLLCSNAHQTRHHTLPRGSANRTTADKSLYVRNLHGKIYTNRPNSR